jgi:hypothetical protein
VDEFENEGDFQSNEQYVEHISEEKEVSFLPDSEFSGCD